MPRRDANQMAYDVVKVATEGRPTSDKDPTAVRRGRRGGLRGGPARSRALSKKRRMAIARKAAKARWGTSGRT